MSKTLGEKIRWLRVKLGKSQKETGALLGLSLAAYSKIEVGITDINISRLNQIAALFEVNPASLLLDEEPGISGGNKELTELKTQLQTSRQKILDLQQRLLIYYEKAI